MQQIKQNYFQLFGIPESFTVDLDVLAGNYRQLQNEMHPDRYANADEAEKLRAVQQSSLLNQAYDTLRSPLQRAGYLLTLQGCDIEQVSQQDLGMDLLLEQMQLREALDELPRDESALADLETLKGQVNEKLAQRQQRFAELIESQVIDEAKQLYHELQFLFKLHKEIESGEEQRLGY